MNFFNLKTSLSKHVSNMLKDIDYLHFVDGDKDHLWEIYLNSFPAGTNEIYRQRKEYDCSCCRHFIKQFGNVVSIKNGKMTSIWDFEVVNEPQYQVVINALSSLIKNAQVKDFFITSESKFGTDKNYEQLEGGNIKTWEHFYIELPNNLKSIIQSKHDVASKTAELRDVRNVFKRSLDELSENSILTVLEMIAQNSLYRGEEWEKVLKAFLTYHKTYHKLKNQEEKELYCWEQSVIAGPAIGKIRNHSIGVLLTDITEGMDLNNAVSRYEKIVAPENYKRPKALYTQKMLDDAKNKVQELGLLDSLGRRFACLDDIKINNILFADKDVCSRLNGSDNVFDEMRQDLAINPKAFDKVEEITIEDFIKNVLPTTKSIEALVENRCQPNFVSLIAPKIKDSPTLFKWSNNFSWAYSGNIADSSMKERVKAAGGKVDGVLRFSIQWNENNDNPSDLDAHCVEPGGTHIYFSNKRYIHKSSGMLDVDIVCPGNNIAVENIVYNCKENMPIGEYTFYVNCFTNKGGKSGFTAEIEFDGQIYSFAYNEPLRQSENIEVAKITYSKEKGFTIKELIPSQMSSRKVWKLNTNQFYPVTVFMYSPNYWDDQKGIGNKHYFFMLKDCINNESPNGFFNEYLKESLLEHKHVFEALGSKMRVEDIEDQLSGIGFSSTKRNYLVCKVVGHTTRTLKIMF